MGSRPEYATQQRADSVVIDVWSDYVCPFCYLAEPVLAEVEQEFPGILVRWHAFELRPEPVPTLDPNGEYLRDVWDRAVYPMAESRGMLLRLPPVQPRSRMAHEAAAFARDHRRFTDLNHAVFRAFFEEGKDIGDPIVLEQLGKDAGLDAGKLRDALRGGDYRKTVLEDEATAQRLGLTGVPASLVRTAGDPLEGGALIEGAQSLEIFRRAIWRVRDTGRDAKR